jgi:hypothetical protein
VDGVGGESDAAGGEVSAAGVVAVGSEEEVEGVYVVVVAVEVHQ